MCISPGFIWIERGPVWEQQPKPCGDCWRCRQNRVNDYVGRALCEAQMSVHVATVNLTYRDQSDNSHREITPRHFQMFMKSLRNAGHKIRYLVAGEYGEGKGRAHFHAILFFDKLIPLAADAYVPIYEPEAHADNAAACGAFCRDIPQKQMVHLREWPHGHATVDWSASEASIRYVCKYLLSDNKNNAWFSLSKKPPLGAAWFAKKAAVAVELAVLPVSFEYLPPGGEKGRKYLMTGATRRDYLNAITTDPAHVGRMSEWVRKTFEKHERQRLLLALNSQPWETIWQALVDRYSTVVDDPDNLLTFSDYRAIFATLSPEYLRELLDERGTRYVED